MRSTILSGGLPCFWWRRSRSLAAARRSGTGSPDDPDMKRPRRGRRRFSRTRDRGRTSCVPVEVPQPSEKAMRYYRSGMWLWALTDVLGPARARP